MSTAARAAFVVACVVAAGACGTRGDDAAQEGSMAPTLRVESPAFAHEASIPPKYTADGDDVSPPLSWSAGPQGTRGYALVCDDPDAPGGTWVHWVIWNLADTTLAEGIPAEPRLPSGAVQGRNSWGRAGYGGPAPPSGTHRYFFRVYALDAALDLAPQADKAALDRAMKGHVTARGELMGRYARQK